MSLRSCIDLIERLRLERAALLSGEYSQTASRRVEEIDQLEDGIWQMLDMATPRTYGA